MVGLSKTKSWEDSMGEKKERMSDRERQSEKERGV